MKTLQEIIERNDYKNINSSLKKRAYELAEKIHAKYEELCPVWDSRKEDVPQFAVHVGSRWYTVRYNVYSYNGVKETEGTCLCVFPDWLEKEWFSLEYQPHAVYATKTPAAVFVQFLNDAAEIIQRLDEKESELVADAEKAMNAAANL